MQKAIDLFFLLDYNLGEKNIWKDDTYMKIPGMLRKVDDLGRLVIPHEIRKAMEIGKGDVLELSLEADCLVVRKFAPACIFCGGIEDLMTYEGRNICGKCVQTIKDS